MKTLWTLLTLLMALFLAPVYAADTDGDSIEDDVDNCSLVFNSSQCDSDVDGFGNHCDADLDNNNVTDDADYTLFRTKLGIYVPAPVYGVGDFNCNNFTNAFDYVILRRRLGSPPGPSGVAPE
jgi:hypothetical protein